MSETTTTTAPHEDAPPRRLVRVREGRWLGGVAAGLGRYFDVNPLVYRIAFAALAFAGGTGILLYVAALLVMPAEDREESVAVELLREHRDRPWLVLGVGLLFLVAVLVLSEADLWAGAGNIWLAAVLAGVALLWWHLARREPPAAAATEPGAPRSHRPSLLAPVLGALLAAAGVFGLLAVLGVYVIAADLALAAAVAIVGAAVAVGALTGYRVGALVVLGVALFAAFGIAASSPVSVSSGIGDKLERPLDATALERTYEFGVGEFALDLASVALAPGRTEVDVSLGIGELVVTVPAGAGLEIDAHAGIGEVTVLGETQDGIDTGMQRSVPGATADAPVLVLDADVGLGDLQVRRG